MITPSKLKLKAANERRKQQRVIEYLIDDALSETAIARNSYLVVSKWSFSPYQKTRAEKNLADGIRKYGWNVIKEVCEKYQDAGYIIGYEIPVKDEIHEDPKHWHFTDYAVIYLSKEDYIKYNPPTKGPAYKPREIRITFEEVSHETLKN